MKKEILFMIGTNLKNLRINNNIKQTDLCNYLNINRSTYANWENGATEIPLIKLDLVAIYYHINIDYILGIDVLKENNNKINFEIFSSRITKFMKENKLTIKALAIDAFTTPSTIWAYIHNKQQIRITYLYLICKNNNVSADYLLGKID